MGGPALAMPRYPNPAHRAGQDGPRRARPAGHRRDDRLVRRRARGQSRRRGTQCHSRIARAGPGGLAVTGARAADRVEHAAVVPPELAELVRAAGVTVVTQTGFVANAAISTSPMSTRTTSRISARVRASSIALSRSVAAPTRRTPAPTRGRPSGPRSRGLRRGAMAPPRRSGSRSRGCWTSSCRRHVVPVDRRAAWPSEARPT
jgi:hypothetical protein